MGSKYFNDGIIGNDRVRASFTETGELIRLYYDSSDYKQFLDFFHTGIKVNDSGIIYLHDDINNEYSQNYIEGTNILETHIYNKYFKVKISQTDFVPIDDNFLVRDYIIRNDNIIDLQINFLLHSKIFTNCNNDTSGFYNFNSLIQYNHDFSICTFSNHEILSRQINGVLQNFNTGIIGGKDYIGMSPNSALSYDLKRLLPGEEKRITLFIYINDNEKIDVINGIESKIEEIRKLDVDKIKDDTRKYWITYLNNHNKLIENRKVDSRIKKIFDRTILLYPLLTNQKTGGISAGIEVDENKRNCGRYSYCWTRDAAFVTETFDILQMTEQTEKFYSNFCRKTQSKNGMWEQRFYTDGRLAPCWGYQIDETASVVLGIYEHYEFCGNKEFIKDNLDMLEKAINFLEEYINNILENKNNLPLSYDIWEEFEGVSLYSLSSIYAAFSSMLSMYNEIRDTFGSDYLKVEKINNKITRLNDLKNHIKEYCSNLFYDENRKSYVRNLNDRKIDISFLATIIQFKMFSIEDIKVKNTIEKINLILKTYTDGYIRYEDDGYMGGKNPWPIATLWMAWYYLEEDNFEQALKCFNFVVNSSSIHGFLGEQINNDEMKPCWVIGLTWSHAMFIITLKKLLEKGLLN